MHLFQLSLAVLCLIHTVWSYSFNEELLVENLPDGHALLHFQFNTVWETTNHKESLIKNYDLFPKRLGDLVSKFKLDELKLTLSQGTWKNDKWGVPSVSAPSGSELWGLFQNGLSQELVDEYWLQSSRTLSGLFGLSINLDTTPNTVNPKFLHLTQANSTSINPDNVRYVSIPNEIVCTENLTPWIKLLPCARNKGLGHLFKNIQKLFESQYLLAGLNFKRKCLDERCLTQRTELKQTLSLVYNLNLLKARRTENEIVWSFNHIFGNKIQSVCPIADASTIYMDLGSEKAPTVPFTKKEKLTNEKSIFVFDLKSKLKESSEFNPLVISEKRSAQLTNQLLSIHRYITNSNERSFGLRTMITSMHSKKMSVVYLETIPWYFRVYINTLQIEKSDGTVVKPEQIHFMPGLDRKRPNHLEIEFELEPKSQYSIYFKVEYAYLKWDEYPPDVNHGFHINPAMISIKLPLNDLSNTQFRTFNLYSSLNDSLSSNVMENIEVMLLNMYSETLLMNLPVPDFSMPYNVICLTCTVIAIAFGSLHNFTTRKFVFHESKTFKEQVMAFVQKLFARKK